MLDFFFIANLLELVSVTQLSYLEVLGPFWVLLLRRIRWVWSCAQSRQIPEYGTQCLVNPGFQSGWWELWVGTRHSSLYP